MQRRRRKKIIFIFLAALILIVSAASAYMNALALASNMKLALMNEIEGATRKKLFFQSIRVNPATGLVIDGPVLYDGSSVVFRAKKASCLLLAMPVLKKMIIIPELKIESPTLLVERMPDNSFPILELIPKEYISPGGLNVAIRRLKLKNGSIEFVDHTLEPPFKKRLTKADLDIRFSIRNKVVFTFSGALETDPPAGIKASGEYSVPKDELRAECVIDDIQLMDFTEYYGASGFYFPEGTVGAKISIDSAGGIIDAGIKAETKRLNVLKDNISARVDSFIKAYVRYDTRSGQTEYAGTADIRSMDISGIEAIGELSGIKAKVEFDDSRLSSDNVLVEALGIQWKVKINLVNYNDPILDIYAGCETVLSAFQRGLEEKFGMDLGVVLAGKGEIDCAIQIRSDHPPKLNGYIRAQDAMIRLGGGNMLLEHVKGEAHFTPNNLKWSGVDLTCGGKVYKSSGELTNFKSPGIQLDVSSKEMSFESVLAIAGKTLNFSKLDGKYLNSYFSVTGSVDTGDPGALPAKIKGVLDIDLKDLNGIAALREFQDKAKAEGRVNAEFSTDGDIKDIKGCKIETGVKSAYLSLYGLKLERPTMNYFQEKGLGQIRALRSSFYGGSLWAAAKVDWNRKDLPYSANFDIKEVRLELLKKDMGFKDKDVSGDIKIYCGINGSLKDASAVGGAGKISIAKGKLWQLDLFKGLGMLIFTSDFSDIVFADGSCNFRIEDEAFTTNDLILRSGLLDLSGAGRIGFDKSIKAALKSELAEEAMYPGAKMNLAVAIGKYTYIDVVGTLEEPMFKIRPSFSDMAEDIKNVFRGE